MLVPIRKPGKYTHAKPDPYITEEKFIELKNKLEKLKNFSRPRAAEEVKHLALDGDFSENHAYQMAKGRLRGINQHILDIEDHLKRAIIIKPQINTDKVRLGCQVTVETNGKIKTYLILGSSETDPNTGVISHNSPLGSTLLNKKVGDTVKVNLANKVVEYKIVEIK
ncbi:MAG: GreA/GreB family elongation factor [Patescibacteria group bacterium]|nr:GreA/GreB family elongation factor [Patescibacteria group bacterium]MDD4610683.1 GreA/GreB family elongation factor [Patescibacteria group bacterium]